IYQNVDGRAHKDPARIKANLIAQLTAPVRWTQTMRNMLADGANKIVEVGPGNILQGLFKKVSREVEAVAG
nr:[acyl-carrier-protein] S-malonyltransferase [Bacteroidota bacterium]